MIQAPTFDLNVPFNRNDAIIGDYATQRNYKELNFDGIYGYGINADFTNSTSGWGNFTNGLKFVDSTPYLGNTVYQSGLFVFSIDYIPPVTSGSDTISPIFSLVDSGGVQRVTFGVYHSYGPNIIQLYWSAVNFSGSFNTVFSSAVGSYTLGRIEIVAWRMTATGSNVTINFYRNGATSGSSLGNVASLTKEYGINVARSDLSSFNTNNLAFTLYDIQLFDYDIGSGYGTSVTSPGGYNNYIQTLTSNRANTNRKYFLYSTISNPGISVVLTGQQATFDFRRLTIPRPTQVDFTLIK